MVTNSLIKFKMLTIWLATTNFCTPSSTSILLLYLATNSVVSLCTVTGFGTCGGAPPSNGDGSALIQSLTL